MIRLLMIALLLQGLIASGSTDSSASHGVVATATRPKLICCAPDPPVRGRPHVIVMPQRPAR